MSTPGGGFLNDLSSASEFLSRQSTASLAAASAGLALSSSFSCRAWICCAYNPQLFTATEAMRLRKSSTPRSIVTLEKR